MAPRSLTIRSTGAEFGIAVGTSRHLRDRQGVAANRTRLKARFCVIERCFRRQGRTAQYRGLRSIANMSTGFVGLPNTRVTRSDLCGASIVKWRYTDPVETEALTALRRQRLTMSFYVRIGLVDHQMAWALRKAEREGKLHLEKEDGDGTAGRSEQSSDGER